MDIIASLRTKYATDEYMTQKLEQYLNHLPVLMKTIEETQQEREVKRIALRNARDVFVSNFTHSNPYYYIPQTELYLDHDRFTVVPEDHILHRIGTNMEKTMMGSKFKITQSILKSYKEKNIFKAPMDAYMLKLVIQSLPFSKSYALYFLAILGDILLNKRNAFVYYLDVSYKPFLKQLNRSICLLLHKSIGDVFKHKYHEHQYELCRVISGTCTAHETPDPLRVVIAAINVSTKYGSSDAYVMNSDIADNVMMLHRHTPDTLIQTFLSSYTTSTGTPISYKDLYFLWKTFLRENYLPYVVTQHKFKSVTQLIQPLCMNSTVAQLPLLHVKHFWEKYVVFDEDASYDIQEMIELYNQYERVPIQHSTMKAFLSVEYPQLTDHIIPNIKCMLWDKEFEIDTAMEVYKHHVDYSCNLEEMYAFYLEYTHLHHRRAVTKSYFEKHVNL
jgi:hypothetical protein